MKTSIVSLLCVCCVCSAEAALRVGNSGTGRGGTYTAVQSQVATETPASQQEIIATAKTSKDLGLSVRVADMELARQIAANNPNAGITSAQLDACAAIYPMGAFAWDTPTSGNQSVTGCVADVEMRMVNGTDDIVLASARVAAGDVIKCNISNFPQSGYTTNAGSIIFPADREPTMDEVIATMNKEQKQNAGMKIAAATIIGGLGGNFVGQNDPGTGGSLGTSSDKMTKTAIGAIALGGLTAISTQSGKVGGDVIMGATVNAIGGGLIGNISGIGDAVLLTRKCEGTDCLYGYVAKNTELGGTQAGFLGTMNHFVRCNVVNGGFNSCGSVHFEHWSLSGVGDNYTKSEDLQRNLASNTTIPKYCLIGSEIKPATLGCDGGEIFYQMTSAEQQGNPQAAVIVGWNAVLKTNADFKQWRRNAKNPDIRFRYNDGTIGQPVSKSDFSARDFVALTQDATDGAIIDLNNSARTNATLTGAGVGAGLGGFSAYQGATTDVENRWVAEVQAYKDSMTKIYCATGKRYLSQYNEVAIIPAMGN